MKVILVHNSYQNPGGEDVVFELERQLLERAGHQVITYCRSNWEIGPASFAGRLAFLKRVVWAEDTRREIAGLLRREKPQLVHVHNTFFMVSPSIYSACQEAHIPVVQTLHNFRLLCPAATLFRDGKLCEECVEHTLWRGVRYGCFHDSRLATAGVAVMLAAHRRRGTWTQGVDCYVALSEFARTKFVEGGLPAEKILVKPNFVYPDPGARNGDGGYALYVGRLAAEKKVGTLLEAWDRIRNRIPLLVIGDGPQRAELEAEAARRGLSSVRFQGHLPRHRALAAINGARFLVFPSEWYENFPVTIAEAFACSTPVICSRMGAMQEIVTDGRTGLHFTPGDPEELAQKVEWAWTHPERMRVMGKEARQEYETKYTAEKNYLMLMDIYQRAMAKYA